MAAEPREARAGRGGCRAQTLAFAATALALAIPFGFLHDNPYTRIDSAWYTLIAQGRSAEAMQPFVARQLAPLLARGLAAVTHASLPHCFLAIGLLSLAVLALTVGWLLCRGGVRWPVWATVACLYFWPATFGAFMLPDTLSAALLGLFLLALWSRKFAMAAILLLPMFLARESTILVLLCLLITGFRQLRWRMVLLAVASSAAGMAIVRVLSTHGHANREHINPLLYMAGKVPWNLAANVLALGPWMPSLNNNCQVPRWTISLPLNISGSATAGLCGWQPAWQAHVLLLALCSFGLLPLLVLYLLRYHRARLWAGDLFSRFCVVYGLLSFLVAPLLGHTVERLFFYGWPVFLLAAPIAASHVFAGKLVSARIWVALFSLHFATAWLDMPVSWYWDQRSWQVAWSLLLLVVAINIAAWALLRRADRSVAA